MGGQGELTIIISTAKKFYKYFVQKEQNCQVSFSFVFFLFPGTSDAAACKHRRRSEAQEGDHGALSRHNTDNRARAFPELTTEPAALPVIQAFFFLSS